MTAARWLAGDPLGTAREASVRLFCFAHAGGGAVFFRPWRTGLAPEIDARPVLLPGRESRIRELPCRRVEQLLEPLHAAVQPYLDRPYALFGHSMGSVIAYELARRLCAGSDPPPACLLVSGRRAPRLGASRPPLGPLPDGDFLAAVARLDGTPREVLSQPRLLAALLPALRADFELEESYEPLPGDHLTCPVAAYMGAADPAVDRRELLAWQGETAGEFTLRVFPGDHFYLQGGRPDVLSAVRQELVRVVPAMGLPNGRSKGFPYSQPWKEPGILA